MLHELTYSLIRHLKDHVPKLTEVVWEYSGVSLDDKEKPFASVYALETGNENLSKERLYYEEDYRFQIGLYTETHSELARLSSEMKNALRQPEITLYDTSDEKPEKSGYFYADLRSETPIPPDELEDETRRHRIYYDVRVTVQQTINKE